MSLGMVFQLYLNMQIDHSLYILQVYVLTNTENNGQLYSYSVLLHVEKEEGSGRCGVN